MANYKQTYVGMCLKVVNNTDHSLLDIEGWKERLFVPNQNLVSKTEYLLPNIKPEKYGIFAEDVESITVELDNDQRSKWYADFIVDFEKDIELLRRHYETVETVFALVSGWS